MEVEILKVLPMLWQPHQTIYSNSRFYIHGRYRKHVEIESHKTFIALMENNCSSFQNSSVMPSPELGSQKEPNFELVLSGKWSPKRPLNLLFYA